MNLGYSLLLQRQIVLVLDISELAKGAKERTDNKTWRGRVAKKFKRYGSSSSTQPEVTGTFGVPLELCPPSSFSEVTVLSSQLTCGKLMPDPRHCLSFVVCGVFYFHHSYQK